MINGRINADIPFFAVAKCQHAVNQTFQRIRALRKIFPAVTDVCWEYLEHIHRPSPGFHPPVAPHRGQVKPVAAKPVKVLEAARPVNHPSSPPN